jgi:hypothetical protein
MSTTTWTADDVRALGVRTDVATAGSIFGLSRTQSYLAVRDGRFPVNVIRVGRRLVVPVPPILLLLGIGRAETADRPPAAIPAEAPAAARRIS